MKIRALLISVIMVIFTIAISLSDLIVEAESSAGVTGDDKLYTFNLSSFLEEQPNSKLAYDYMKLATALQGLVNKSDVQLFFHYESNSVAREAGMEIDQFWLEELTKQEGQLSSNEVIQLDSFEEVLDTFSDYYEGVVLWDSNVPATANVASTAAGVENILPVRYDESPNSPYQQFVVDKGLSVKLDLVNKFTGEGIIPDTDEPSTGSAKNDAYMWAKARYLDSGLTNETLMVYALDGTSWSIADQSDFNARVISTSLPRKMEVGQEVDISITLENTGDASWTMDTNDRLGATGVNEFSWTNLNGGYSNSPGNQRVFLGSDEEIAKGEQKVFEFTIIAPETEGSYRLQAQMIRDGVTWFGEILDQSIEVVSEGSEIEPPVEVTYPPSDEEFVYPDLFNSFLPNADYFIANKAFFFDLSPDETTVPNDDPTQPVGTDYHTLIELLRSQNQRAGEQIFTIGGFVPWWLKYTTHADPNASLGPVPAEWKYADIISQYNAQKDADAFGLIGLSNASVYQHIELNEEFEQKNDKGKNGKTYDETKKYVTFYMGDYDSGAWTAGALPALWNDPKRGELPLAWPLVANLSNRVPQMFNYLFDTMTSNDYFVAGNNGAGYLNPIMLLEENRPDGLPDFLDVWEEYNHYYYDKFDLDITGFLISGNAGQLPLEVQEVYSRLSPVGVGNNGGFEEPIVNGTPFSGVRDLGLQERNAEAYGEQLADQLRRNQQFHIFRNILMSPSVIVDAVDYVKENYPELEFEVVDPYTYFNFYKEADPGSNTSDVTYNSTIASTPITIDGIVEETEWNDATAIEVSANSEIVQQYGMVWGDVNESSDLSTTYRIKWDKDYLYLLEERKDDALQFTETGNQMFLSDASMLFLDLDHNKSGSAYRDGDYAILMTPNGPDGNSHLYLREGNNDGVNEYPLSNGQIGSTIYENGYTMEVAIPWDDLQVIPFSPEQDSLVGMTLLATDNDGSNNWGQIMWVGEGDNQKLWADMKFVANEISTVKEGIAKLNQLIVTNNLKNPFKNKLENSFRQVEHHLEKGHDRQAIHHLDNFQKHLQNKGMQKFLDPKLKQELLIIADEIRGLLKNE